MEQSVPSGAIFSFFLNISQIPKAHWPLILLNALNAFALNVVIATTLKRLSAVAFVIIGIVKDSVIVATSGLVFGDHISAQQQVVGIRELSGTIGQTVYDTGSTARGGGGNFKNKKLIGEVNCCESGVAERIH